MLDLLSFVTNQLAQRQQAEQASASRALQQKLAEEELAQRQSQFLKDLGFREESLHTQTGLSRDEMAQRNAQFLKNLGFQEGRAKAEDALNRDKMLFSLAERYPSPQLLSLLGGRYGVPSLGSEALFGNGGTVGAGLPRMTLPGVSHTTLEDALPWRSSILTGFGLGRGK